MCLGYWKIGYTFSYYLFILRNKKGASSCMSYLLLYKLKQSDKRIVEHYHPLLVTTYKIWHIAQELRIPLTF